MAILYLPSRILKKTASERKIKKLLTKKLTVNRAALATLADTGVVSKKRLSEIALKVAKGYKKRYRAEREEGATVKEAAADAVNGGKLLVQRVQNETVFQIGQEIKAEYEGEFYEWLPSDAEEPDPLHQLNYGQVFRIGDGEQPGDRYGCRCGMNILVPEKKLEL